MKWPWVSRKAAKLLAEDAAYMADKGAREAMESQLAGYAEALRLRTEEVGLHKGDAHLANQALDSIERVDALHVTRHAGETWREYNQRILQAFKEGADGTLFKAILDEVGRYERQAFVDCTSVTDPSKLMRGMGAVDMARTLKMRLVTLAGRADHLAKREQERRERTEMAFSDIEDGILASEVLAGRIPRR